MWQASSGGIWRWTMSPELDSVATAFVGSAALTSMFVVLAMIGTLNHYHRPIIPVLGALLVMLSCTYLLAWADGTAVDTLALRMTLCHARPTSFCLPDTHGPASRGIPAKTPGRPSVGPAGVRVRLRVSRFPWATLITPPSVAALS